MNEVVIVSYRQGVLQSIMPLFDIQSNITIVDEQIKTQDFLHASVDEIWLDGYIDLYDTRLNDSHYLYHFFIRLEDILKMIQQSRFKPTIRILRNFYYNSTHPELKKVFLRYEYLMSFIKSAYPILELVVPDLLNKAYFNHPYHTISKKTLLWNVSSSFRIIHPNDIVYNLLEHKLEKNDYVISGLIVGMGDLCEKVAQIFGEKPTKFDQAYLINVQDLPPMISLNESNYNLETIFMAQLY
ncbi:MAG: hypothetical protein ACRCVW_04690 [Brevinema sp.]